MRFLAWLAVVCMLASCGGDDAGSSDRTSSSTSQATSSSSTSTERPDPVEAAVLEAYDAYWAMFLRVSDPPNPADPEIPQRATGNRLVALIEALQRNAQEQTVIRLPEMALYEHNPEVVTLEADRAEIRDCSIDDGLLIRSTTGEVLNDVVATHLIESILRLEWGAWKVAESNIVERWEGVAGCALELSR